MNIFNTNDPKLRGDNTDDRLDFANDYIHTINDFIK